MKKLLLLILPFLFFTAKAQITFPAPGATWHYLVQGSGASGPSVYLNTQVQYTNDTVFMGRPVKVLGANISNFTLLGISTGNTFIYTSNDSVFFYNATTLNQWQLLYSFSTRAGQSWQLTVQDYQGIDTIQVHVDSVKYTPINSLSLTTLFVTYNLSNDSFKSSYHSVIYDKIGDINYMLNFPSAALPICDGCYITQGLLCYQDSTFNLYQPDTSKACDYTTVGINQLTHNTQLNIYPNPATNVLNVELGILNENAEIKLFDVNGKLVLSQTIQGNTNIDVGNLNSGVYNVNINGVTNKRLVIVK